MAVSARTPPGGVLRRAQGGERSRGASVGQGGGGGASGAAGGRGHRGGVRGAESLAFGRVRAGSLFHWFVGSFVGRFCLLDLCATCPPPPLPAPFVCWVFLSRVRFRRSLRRLLWSRPTYGELARSRSFVLFFAVCSSAGSNMTWWWARPPAPPTSRPNRLCAHSLNPL